MKRLLLVLLLTVLLVSCGSSSIEDAAKNVVEEYVKTLDNQDVDGQLAILSGGDIDRSNYYNSFLKHVVNAESVSITKAYENDFLLTLELQLNITMDETFKGNGRLVSGENLLTRYFTFRKEDLKLFEIFDKLIIEDPVTGEPIETSEPETVETGTEGE